MNKYSVKVGLEECSEIGKLSKTFSASVGALLLVTQVTADDVRLALDASPRIAKILGKNEYDTSSIDIDTVLEKHKEGVAGINIERKQTLDKELWGLRVQHINREYDTLDISFETDSPFNVALVLAATTRNIEKYIEKQGYKFSAGDSKDNFLFDEAINKLQKNVEFRNKGNTETFHSEPSYEVFLKATGIRTRSGLQLSYAGQKQKHVSLDSDETLQL